MAYRIPHAPEGIEHNALIFDGLGDFLAATAPFLRDGLAEGNVLVAVVPEPRLSALRDTLGPDGAGATFVDAAAFYRHPVRTIKDYDKLVREVAPLRLRVVAEPVWRGRGPAETVEWTRYESLVNAAFSSSGAHVICAYDRAAVPEPILLDARRTHPQVISGQARYPSLDYLDPAAFGAGCDRTPRTPPPADAGYLPFAAECDLQAVRAFATGWAVRHGLAAERVQALETAVTEVATNALRHGTAPMGLRVWTTPGELVCEVGDHGFWQPEPLIGYVPPESVLEPGFGLWTVRLLVDRMRVYAGWDGTFVRLYVAR